MMGSFESMLHDVYLEETENSNLLVSTEDDDCVKLELSALSCTD